MALGTWLKSWIPGERRSATVDDIVRAAATDRPGLNAIDMINFGFVQPVLRNAYTMHENCSLLSDIAQTLTHETFRPGIDIEAKFLRKCTKCGFESNERIDKCPACGSEALRGPSEAQKLLLTRSDGYNWLEKVNDNGQSLAQLGVQGDLHLNTCDNEYVLAIQDYLFYRLGDKIPPGFEVGDVSDSFVQEFIVLDPRFVEKVFDASGRPGTHDRICLKHRDRLLDQKQKRCPLCGMKTKDVAYRYYSSTESLAYFTDDEIKHLIKYYPNPLYGMPPAFKLRMNVFAYMYIEARIKSYYEKGRPPGVVAISTDNPNAVDENVKKLNAQFLKDPYALPWMPVSTGQGRAARPVEYVQFMQDPSADMLAVKDEIRRAICSFHSVSPIFMADVESSKGLSNAGYQITILNRGIEYGQAPYNDQLFPWIMKKLHITDWVFHLKRAEQADEKDSAELQLLKDQHAMNLQNMGFKVWMHDGDYHHDDYPENPPQSAGKLNAGMNMPIPSGDLSPGSSAGEFN